MLGAALLRWISQLLFYSRSGANYPGRIFMAVTWWPVTTRTRVPASDVTEVIIHYPRTMVNPVISGSGFATKAKYAFVAHLDPGWRFIAFRCRQLTIPYCLDEELWFIHPHQFWTWKISDDTRLLFNCTGSGDKKSSWLIIIRLTTENWKWLFVSLA